MMIMDAIDTYATKWCKREKASSELVLLKESIKDIVTKKLARFSKCT